jgi:hypothetical protein
MYKTAIFNCLNHHIHNSEIYTHIDVTIMAVHFHGFTLVFLEQLNTLVNRKVKAVFKLCGNRDRGAGAFHSTDSAC